MTIEDANYLLGVAEANFGYAFRSMTNDQKVMLVHSWAFGLQDIPADIVMMAFMQLTTCCDWLPRVKEIREQVRKLRIEAQKYFDLQESEKRMYEMIGQKWEPPQDGRTAAVKKYIVENTETLDKGTGLSLNTALRGSYCTPIGSGQMGFDEIKSGRGGYLPPRGRQS